MELPILSNRPEPGQTADALANLPVVQLDMQAAKPLPMSMKEMRERGWDEADVVIVTGDAYVDHPSMAMAILGRVLEAAGCFAWGLSANLIGIVATIGGASVGLVCSSELAPAIWTP